MSDDSDVLLKAVEAEMERRQRDEPLRYVKLNEPSAEYARALLNVDSYIALFAAANGIGKTRTTITAIGWAIWPEQCPPEFQECALIKNWPWKKKIRFVSTPKEMEELGGVQTAIKELWPVGQYTSHKGKKTYPSLYKARGFEMDMMTYDQDPGRGQAGVPDDAADRLGVDQRQDLRPGRRQAHSSRPRRHRSGL